MPLKKKIFLAVSLLYILYTVVPIIPDVTGIEVWLVNLSTFIFIFILYPKAFANRVIFWFIVYIAVLVLYVLLGKPLAIGIGTVADSRKLLIEMAYFLPSMSILSVIHYLKDYKVIRVISLSGLVFIIFSFLYLLPLMVFGNLSLRDALSLEMYQDITVTGVPGYALMHAYIIVLPGLLYAVKKFNMWQKWVMLGVLVLFLFIIVNTYITTSLVITLAVIVFYLLYDVRNKVKSFLLIALVAFAISILHISGAILQVLDYSIEFFEGTAAQGKMEDFKLIYLTGDVESASNVSGRSQIHAISWNAFANNVFFGSSPVGGHSSLIDRLGGMGLFAFIPFLMIIFSQLKRNLLFIRDKEQRAYYYLGFLSALTLLYTKGIFGQEGWLFLMVLMPGLIISFYSVRENQSIRKIYAPDSSFQPSSGFADF